jgi:hypothetical protein
MIPPEIRHEVDHRLNAIQADQDVRFLLAVESGSRAWGFPSPDSDYDIRFVYVRPRDHYLRLTPSRDVIEQPILDEIDLNGWDIRKFLGLLLKSNAVACEWLASPIRYRPDHPIAAKLATLADAIYDPHALSHHYASVGRKAAERWLDGDEPVAVKRYFYALRPALAIRAIRLNPDQRPPMNLAHLITAADLPADLSDMIAELVAAKRQMREHAASLRMPDLEQFIRDELACGHALPPRATTADGLATANTLFLDLINE